MALFIYVPSSSRQFHYEFNDKVEELRKATTADIVQQTKEDLMDILTDTRYDIDAYDLEQAQKRIDTVSWVILSWSHDEISMLASQDAWDHAIIDSLPPTKDAYTKQPPTLNKAATLTPLAQITSKSNTLLNKIEWLWGTVLKKSVKKAHLEWLANWFLSSATVRPKIVAYFNEKDVTNAKTCYDAVISAITTDNTFQRYLNTKDPDQAKEVASLLFLWIRMKLGSKILAEFDNDQDNIDIWWKIFNPRYGKTSWWPITDDNRRRRYRAITKDEMRSINDIICNIGTNNILEQAKDEVKTEIAKKRNAIEKMNELTSISYPDPVELGWSLPWFDTKVKNLLPDLDTATTWQRWIATLSGTKPIIWQGKEIGKVTGTWWSVTLSLHPVSILKAKGIDPETFPWWEAMVEIPYAIDGTSSSKTIGISFPISKPKNNASIEYWLLATTINSCLDRVSQLLWTDAIRKLYAGNPKFTSLNDDQQKKFLGYIEQMAWGTTTINGATTPDTAHPVFGPLATWAEAVATSFRWLRKKLKDDRKNLHWQDSYTLWTEVLKTMKRSLGLAETETFDSSNIDPSKMSLDASLFADWLSTQLTNPAIPWELDDIITRFRNEEIAAKALWYDDIENKKIYGPVFVSQYEQAQKDAFYTFLKAETRVIGGKKVSIYDHLVERAREKNRNGKRYKDDIYINDLFLRTIGHSQIDDIGNRRISQKTWWVALSHITDTHFPPLWSANVIDDSHKMIKQMLIDNHIHLKDKPSFDQAIQDFFANGDNTKQRIKNEASKKYDATVKWRIGTNITRYLNHLNANTTYSPVSGWAAASALLHSTITDDGTHVARSFDITAINGIDVIREDLVTKLEKEAPNINIDKNIVSKYFYKVYDRAVSLGSSESSARVKAKRVIKKLIKKKVFLHAWSPHEANKLLKECGLKDDDRRELLEKIENASERAKYEARIWEAIPWFTAITKHSIDLSDRTKQEIHNLLATYILGERASWSWVQYWSWWSKTWTDTEKARLQNKLANIIDSDVSNRVWLRADSVMMASNVMKMFEAKKVEINLLRKLASGEIADHDALKTEMETYRREHGTYPPILIDAAKTKPWVFEWSPTFFEQAKIQAQDILHDRSPSKARQILDVDSIKITVYKDVYEAGTNIRDKAQRIMENSLDIRLARNPKKWLLWYAAIKMILMTVLWVFGVTWWLAWAVIPAGLFAWIYAGWKSKWMDKEDLAVVMRLIQQLKDPAERQKILEEHGLWGSNLWQFIFETDQVAAKLHEFAYKDGFEDEDDATNALKEIGNFMAWHAICQLHGIRMFGWINEANYGRCMKDTYAVAEKYRRRRSRLSWPEKADPNIVPISIVWSTKDAQINSILKWSFEKVYGELLWYAQSHNKEKFADINKKMNKKARTHGAIASLLASLFAWVGYGIAQRFTDTATAWFFSTWGSSASWSTINQAAADLAKYFGNNVQKAEQFTDLVNNKKMLIADARTKLWVTDINDKNSILITLQESYGLNFDKNLAWLTAKNAPEYRARLHAYGYGPVLQQLNINDGASLLRFLKGWYPSSSSDMIKWCWLQFASCFDPDKQPHTFNVVSKAISWTEGVAWWVSDATISSWPAWSYSWMRHVFFKDRLENHLADPNSNDLGDRWSRTKSEVSDIFGWGTVHDKIADDFLTRVMDGQTMNQAINDLGLPWAKYDELVLRLWQDSDWVRSVLDQRMFMDANGDPTPYAQWVYDKIKALHPNLLQWPNRMYSVNEMQTLIQQYMAGQQSSNPAVQKLMGAIMDHSYGWRAELVQHMLNSSETWKWLNMIPHVNMADAVKNSTWTWLWVIVWWASKNLYDEFTKTRSIHWEQSSMAA